MKKLLALLAFLPLAAFAQDDISQSTGIIGNGRLLGAKTYDGQLTVGILGIDSSGNTIIKSISGKDVKIPGTFALTGAATFASNLTFSAASAKIIPGATSLLFRNHADSATNIALADGGGLTFTASPQTVAMDTSDASDNKAMQITAGGAVAFDGTRGAVAVLAGNEVGGSAGGQIQLYGGGVSTGKIRNILGHASATFTVEGTAGTILTADNTSARFLTQITAAGTSDIGWSIVAGANTACNTTCTFACVAGFDSGASNLPVACTNAAADNCLCAGAS